MFAGQYGNFQFCIFIGTIGTGTGPGVINDSPGYMPKQKQGYVNYNKQNQNMMGRTGNQRQNGTTGNQTGRLSPQAQPTQQQQRKQGINTTT